MKRLSILLALSLISGAAISAGSVAHAADTLWVNDGIIGTNTGCDDPGYNTIQDAVTAANADDTIQVCEGTYVESGQIVIDKNLSLVGTGDSKPVVKTDQNTGNNGTARGWFFVEADTTFDIANLVLDGDEFNIWQAIRNTGDGSVTDVDFRNIRYPTYNGTGVAAFGTGPVDVTGSTFESIGRIGVHYFGSNVNGSVYSGNQYTGKGDVDGIDYALDVGNGADVTIEDSTITNNIGVAESDGSRSAGILVTTFFGGLSAAEITGNELHGNTTAIHVGFNDSDVSEVTARFNNISGNEWGVRSTEPTVDATCNYWGHASGPEADDNPKGRGDAVSGDVDYRPWSPRTVAGTNPEKSCNKS